MNLGLAMIGLGLGMKGCMKMYRYIRNKQYIHPLGMYPGGFHTIMNRREAQLILGVGEATTIANIKQRHRLLMINNHPDNGGSTYLATKINQAKEMLASS